MKRNASRRHFIQSSATLMAMAFAGNAFGHTANRQLLSFSTLGCPDWSFDAILSFAVKNNYQGIEIRGIKRELDLTKCKEFNSPENIAATRKLVEDKGLHIVDLGSSAALHQLNEKERQKNLDEAKRFIDLASVIGCPYIRVFPNNLPKEQDRAATIDIIIKNLQQLGEYAKNGPVKVLMESHGDLVYTKDLLHILQATESPDIGLIWDIVNMWSVTKEPPADVYAQLKKYIRHTHIKDMKFLDGKINYTLVGKGETPIFEAIDLLNKDGYKGYYSFEWEKLWHPDIAAPELAIADYAKVMRQHFSNNG